MQVKFVNFVVGCNVLVVQRKETNDDSIILFNSGQCSTSSVEPVVHAEHKQPDTTQVQKVSSLSLSL
jgi:hypothetical protein